MTYDIPKAGICTLILLFLAVVLVFAQPPDEKQSAGTTGPFFSTEDILDWQSFCSKLSKEDNHTSPSPSRRLWKLLSKQTQEIVLSGAYSMTLDQAAKENVINVLNDILKRRDFYQYDDFCLVAAFEAKALLHNHAKDLPENEIERFNRLLLEASYPKEIAKSKTPPGKKTMEDVMKIKSQYEDSLFAIPGVSAIWIGVNDAGLVIHVSVSDKEAVPLIPKNIEGVPVEVTVGGKIKPL
jgi:hypothetical protein